MSKAKPFVAASGSLLVMLALAWFLYVRENADMGLALRLVAGFVLVLSPLFLLRRITLPGAAVITAFGCAIAARLLLLFAPPLLSDDVYRYLWDGKVQMAGHNPYRFAPADSRLPVARDADYELINHKEIPTIYPPLAQFVFFLLASIHASVWSFKVGFVLLDLLLAWLLWRRLEDDLPGRPPPTGALLLYLFHPLLILEFAGSAHVDLLWTLPFVACLWTLERRRPNWALFLFALAISGKLIALAYLPLFWRFAGGRRAATAVAMALASYIPYSSAGLGLLGGLTAYGLFWNFNGFLFPLFGLLPGGALAARIVAPVAGALAAVYIATRFEDVWSAALATTAVMIALLPVNYPWYWAVLVAILVVRPLASALGLSLAMMLTYEILPRYYSTGDWHQALWVRLLQAFFLAALLWEVVGLPVGRFRRGDRPLESGGGRQREETNGS